MPWSGTDKTGNNSLTVAAAQEDLSNASIGERVLLPWSVHRRTRWPGNAYFHGVRDSISSALRYIDNYSRSGFQVRDLGLLIVPGNLGFLVQLHVDVAFGRFHRQNIVLNFHNCSDHVLEPAMSDDLGCKNNQDEAHL